MITPDTLYVWSERLCRLRAGGLEAAQAVLELPAPVVRDGDYAQVTPPPEGVQQLDVSDDLATHTVLKTIELRLDRPGIPLAALIERFGPGREAVRVSARSPYRQWFRVVIPGAPCTCDVFADFPTQPTPSSCTVQIMLRRILPDHVPLAGGYSS